MKLSGRYFLMFSAAFVAGVYLHEVGHAAFGWLEGVAVFPTPAKEYVLQAQLDWSKYIWVALGGPVGTTVAALAAMVYFGRNPSLDSEAILAGALVPPGFYSLRFLVSGRGYGREWQAAQTALGLRPTGHAFDILFLCLSVAAFIVWAIRGVTMGLRPTRANENQPRRPRESGDPSWTGTMDSRFRGNDARGVIFRRAAKSRTGGARKSRLSWLWSLLRLGTMAIAGVVLLLVLQVSNNAVFDRVFRNASVVNVPAGIDTR